MRNYLLVVIIAFFCTLPLAVAQYRVNDTQQEEIELALRHELGNGGVNEYDLTFGSDLSSPVMKVKFEPDVYGGMTVDKMEEIIMSATTKIVQVHLDMLKKYPNLENLELQITYWKPGLGAILSGRPMAG